MTPNKPLLRVLPITKHDQVFNTAKLKALKLIDIKYLQSALLDMHKNV